MYLTELNGKTLDMNVAWTVASQNTWNPFFCFSFRFIYVFVVFYLYLTALRWVKLWNLWVYCAVVNMSHCLTLLDVHTLMHRDSRKAFFSSSAATELQWRTKDTQRLAMTNGTCEQVGKITLVSKLSMGTMLSRSNGWSNSIWAPE